MSRILICNSYFYYFDSKQWKTAKPYPPLGTLYAAAVLRNEGHEVFFFDNSLKKSTAEFSDYLGKVSPDILVVYEDGFNYLTKMCLTNMRQAAFEMAGMASKSGIPSLVSGSDSTDHSALYLDNNFTFIINGEGEITLKEITEALTRNERDFSKIPGLRYLNEGKMLETAPRPTLKNIDELPDPAWDLLDVKPYQEIWLRKHGYFSLNISTTRGCPYKCNWCAKPIYGNVYNSRSPERVAKEMSILVEKFNVDEFWICDDIFGLKRNWVQDFASEVEKTGKKFRYRIQSRVDLMLRDNNLEAMVRSGMEEVWVGAESGSQKILDAMDKGITVEQIHEASRNVRKYGKKICFFLQFGYPGEEREDIEKTIDMLLKIMPDDIGISVSYPLPGTVFYDNVKSEMSKKSNWEESDDLDMMYNGNFSKEFYRNLHKYVHKVYRRRFALNTIKRIINNPFKLSKDQLISALSMLYYLPVSRIYQRMLRNQYLKTEALE